jgi:hypothetical protein
VKENFWSCPSWLLINIFPSANVDVASFTIVWGAPSWFVQVTVVPFGTVTDGGLKAKFWMVTATPGGGDGVVGATVVVVTVGVVAAGV